MRNTSRPAALTPPERVPLTERLALSIDDAAAAMSVSRSTIKAMIRRGQLHPSRATGRTLLDPREIQRVLFGQNQPAEGKESA